MPNDCRYFFFADNPGFCPTVDPMMCPGDQEDSCFDDASCEDNEKCCHDGCRKMCVKPLAIPNAGLPQKIVPRKYYNREFCIPKYLEAAWPSGLGR